MAQPFEDGLARLAGVGADNAFAAKLRLFAAGRWPLGINGAHDRVL